MKDYRLISALTEPQISELTELYKHEFWSQTRTREDVEKMLAASDLIIAFVDESDRLIGFTRILTDFIYRAIVFDVIVKQSHRNQGIGKQLLDAVVHHPQLQSVEVIGLYCLPEMVPFYNRWGFSADLGGIQLMLRSHTS